MDKDNNLNTGNVDFDNNNNDFKRVAISVLLKVIEIENRKPEKNRDYSLLDDCTKLVAELKGIKSELTKEEIAEKYRQAMEKAAIMKAAAKIRRIKRAIITAAVVFLIVLGGIALYAFNPTVHDWIGKMLSLPCGSTVDDHDVTYIHNDVVERYDSIDELLQSLDLDILYPSAFLDDDVVVSSVILKRTTQFDILLFLISDTNYYFHIELLNDNFITSDQSSIYENNGLTFYLRETLSDAMCYFNGNIYSISAPDYDSLIYMIDNLKGTQ